MKNHLEIVISNNISTSRYRVHEDSKENLLADIESMYETDETIILKFREVDGDTIYVCKRVVSKSIITIRDIED